MANKNKCNIDVHIEEVENGYLLTCSCEKKPSLSTRAGWIPAKRDEQKHTFKTADELIKHLKSELDEHMNKKEK